MNYGPLEFADYLRRNDRTAESATVTATRAAQPAVGEPVNQLRVVSGPRTLTAVAEAARLARVSAFEAVTMSPPCDPRCPGAVRVLVKATDRPVVLVLSSHQPVEWHVSRAPGATLLALLLSGYGQSRVLGAEDAAVHRIGGFSAFKRGSPTYRHLESEVQRCTGCRIAHFESICACDHFEIG